MYDTGHDHRQNNTRGDYCVDRLYGAHHFPPDGIGLDDDNDGETNNKGGRAHFSTPYTATCLGAVDRSDHEIKHG